MANITKELDKLTSKKMLELEVELSEKLKDNFDKINTSISINNKLIIDKVSQLIDENFHYAISKTSNKDEELIHSLKQSKKDIIVFFDKLVEIKELGVIEFYKDNIDIFKITNLGKKILKRFEVDVDNKELDEANTATTAKNSSDSKIVAVYKEAFFDKMLNAYSVRYINENFRMFKLKASLKRFGNGNMISLFFGDDYLPKEFRRDLNITSKRLMFLTALKDTMEKASELEYNNFTYKAILKENIFKKINSQMSETTVVTLIRDLVDCGILEEIIDLTKKYNWIIRYTRRGEVLNGVIRSLLDEYSKDSKNN